MDKKARGLKYKRVLLKLSGEALLGQESYGVDPKVIARVSDEIAALAKIGVEIAIVVGGGNIFRGAGLAAGGVDRVTADQMGMLATVINALAIQDSLERAGLSARVMSAIKINEVCEDYIRRRAVRHLEKGRVVVLAAGTGNPFFTTDSAASLRAIEIDADLLIKATKVDGIYDKDPVKNKDARFLGNISYQKALADNLGVMDASAIALARDNQLPIVVFSLFEASGFLSIVEGQGKFSLVS